MNTALTWMPTYSGVVSHSLDGGGSAMEIKQTHPQYETPTLRAERLKDVRTSCLAAVRKVRAKETKAEKRTA